MNILNNKNGSVTFIGMIALVSLTIIGIIAITNTGMELKMAGNDRTNKIAFAAAESGRGYVAGHPTLYSSENVDGPGKDFPLAADDADNNGKYEMPDSNQSFKGTVRYDTTYGATRNIPGMSIGDSRAHIYKMESEGYGPNGSTVKIEHGFFRIGK